MKKLFKKINTKTNRSIVLGLIVSLFIMSASSYAQDTVVVPFIEGASQIIDRNGSLVVGGSTIPTWISSKDSIYPECITKGEGNSSVKTETCLDGGNATFINMLIERSAFLRGVTAVGGPGTTFPGGASRFVIQDVSGDNDSILASGLGFFGSNRKLTPRDLTTHQGLCAKQDGMLFRCITGATPAPVTYSWEVGQWGSCSAGTAASCSGTYSTTGTGSCSGSYATSGTGSCSGTYTEQQKIDWNGNLFDWSADGTYGAGTDYGICTRYEYSVNITTGKWQYIENDHDAYGFDGGQGASGYDPECRPIDEDPTQTNQPIYSTSSSSSCSGLSQSQCTSQAYDGCTWSSGTTTNSCSGLAQSTCTGQSGCTWSAGSTTTNSCSGATSQSTCTGQNSACSWTAAGTGSKSRTVVCKDSNGVTHPDQVCVDNGAGTKPTTTSTDGCSTYAWNTGTWGRCIGSTGSCSGSYTTATPAGPGDCLSGAPGAAGTCGDGSDGAEDGGGACLQHTTYNSCEGQLYCHLGRQYGCEWSGTPPTSTTNSCSTATTSSTCTSLNSACSWNTTGGTTTRTVTCQDQNGTTVADSFCTSSKPITTDGCDGGLDISGGSTGGSTTTSGSVACDGRCTADTQCAGYPNYGCDLSGSFGVCAKKDSLGGWANC